MADARIQWDEVSPQGSQQEQGSGLSMPYPRQVSTWSEKLMNAWNWLITIAIIVIIGSGCGLTGWVGHELTSKPEFSVISAKISKRGQLRLAAAVDELPRACSNSNRTPVACGLLLEHGLPDALQNDSKGYLSNAQHLKADWK